MTGECLLNRLDAKNGFHRDLQPQKKQSCIYQMAASGILMKTEDISVEFSLFVEHGREREAANFYAAAFGAQEENTNDINGVLAAVEMRFGNLPVWVAGSNPNREKSPYYEGPTAFRSPRPLACSKYGLAT